MALRVENCEKCGRAYMLEKYSPILSTGEAPGSIRCPHCGDERRGDPDFVYLGHKLADDKTN